MRDPELNCPNWFEYLLVDEIEAECDADLSGADFYELWEDYCDWCRRTGSDDPWRWWTQLDYEAHDIKDAA